MKDYLSYENARNKKYAALYTEIMQEALGGTTCQCFVGHHLSFEKGGDLSTENEIPSADTLIFDHDLMRAAFGGITYLTVMRHLAALPTELRDDHLQYHWNIRKGMNADQALKAFTPA